MLRKLSVSNLAVVERTEVEFAPGLNVITGETGAGKSVLMGALGLVLGDKADPSLVREGAKEAEVEAVFEFGRGDRRETVTVRRTVTREGRSRAWIDDESVSLGELRAKIAGCVDIHGPRGNQRLAEEGFQRAAVDASARSAAFDRLRTAYAAVYGRYVALAERLAALEAAQGSEDELDMLRYQVSELEEAGISPADDDLAERHAAAAHAEDIVAAANVITEALGGDAGAERALGEARRGIALAARHFPAAAAWAEKAEELSAGVAELSREVADAAGRIDLGEGELERLDARLAVVNRLKRKYGDPVEALARKRARLDELEHREERLGELRGETAAALRETTAAGAELTAARRRAGAKFARAVSAGLKGLGFAQADFAVSVEAAEPSAQGCDRTVFMFAPNPGERARPLAAIASSGEVARVMLAIKALAGAGDEAPTLVFDEIDANIGGETGSAVGAKMRDAARSAQVIAITHLPQTAVWGERHLVVAKTVSGGRTRTVITPVEGEERVSEVARMLGGEHITTVVRKHAKELIGLSR